MQTAKTYSEEIAYLASQTLRENRVAVFIVAYNAEKHIESVLERIPNWVSKKLIEVFIIDDSSKDDTLHRAVSAKWTDVYAPLRVFRTPYNQGYGGNQILGYSYAIAQKFDIVVLLHGDGQYAPEFLPEILAEYSRPSGADAVYGSRFMTRWGALKGGMPLYKFFGNRTLTWIQNKMIGTRMSEMHSGYRSYRTSALKKVPFRANSRGFDFDSDIIIQFAAAGLTTLEVPIPTFYGNEICNVDGLRYAWACIKAAFQYRLMGLEIFYDPKFDFSNRQRNYTHFNYGRRGILDLTHTRLFTVRSFKRLLRNADFQIDAVRCFGPPIADLAGGSNAILLIIDRVSALLARYWKGLFGYQILLEATRPDSVETLIERTFLDRRGSQSCTVSNS
jgi:glycosyltransferase involved in cell wall biosynthesis